MHSSETVSSIAGNNPILNTQNVSGSTPDKGKYVTLDDEEAWNKFFKLQNDPSTNSTNKRTPRPYVHMNDEGRFRYTAEETKYNGKEIVGKVAEQIKEEILKNTKSDVAKVKIKESKNADNSVKPVIRIVMHDNEQKMNMQAFLSGSMCEKYNVKTITFCLPDKSNTRGIRCQINGKVRTYEVANGSYEMTLRWFVEGKECNIKININDDGTIKLIESNGVTEERLKAHKEVKVGRQYEAKFLHEALTSQLQQAQPESAETAKVLLQPSTDVTDVGRQQEHQASVA